MTAARGQALLVTLTGCGWLFYVLRAFFHFSAPVWKLFKLTAVVCRDDPSLPTRVLSRFLEMNNTVRTALIQRIFDDSKRLKDDWDDDSGPSRSHWLIYRRPLRR